LERVLKVGENNAAGSSLCYCKGQVEMVERVEGVEMVERA